MGTLADEFRAALVGLLNQDEGYSLADLELMYYRALGEGSLFPRMEQVNFTVNLEVNSGYADYDLVNGELQLAEGQSLPDWLDFDTETGEVTILEEALYFWTGNATALISDVVGLKSITYLDVFGNNIVGSICDLDPVSGLNVTSYEYPPKARVTTLSSSSYPVGTVDFLTLTAEFFDQTDTPITDATLVIVANGALIKFSFDPTFADPELPV